MKVGAWITMVLAGLSLIGFGAVHSRTSVEAIPGADKGKEGLHEAASQEASKGKLVPTVRVETMARGSLSRTVVLSGTVTPTRTARLASPGEGPVEACAIANCMVREGDRVQKGQILLQISRNKAAQAQVSAAEQMLKEQRKELERIAQLVQGGAVPGAQLDGARSKYENARAQLAKAIENAEDYLVSAPWDGVVSKVYVAEGDYVAPRTPLIEIFDPASLVVQFAIPESQSTEVQEKMPLQIEFDAHSGQVFRGVVSRVYPQLDDRTRTRSVEAALTDEVNLIPGMFARIQVVLARIPDALTVPAHCLLATQEGGFSAFIVEGGKAVRRNLRTGVEVDGRRHIVSGLDEGDRVIVAGQETLKEGAEVKVVEEEASHADAAVKGEGRS